jgi:hypothetical protein
MAINIESPFVLSARGITSSHPKAKKICRVCHSPPRRDRILVYHARQFISSTFCLVISPEYHSYSSSHIISSIFQSTLETNTTVHLDMSDLAKPNTRPRITTKPEVGRFKREYHAIPFSGLSCSPISELLNLCRCPSTLIAR